MLMTEFLTKFLNHGVHLVFQVEFLLLQPDLFEMILLCHVVAIMQCVELNFVQPVFFDQTAKLRVRGHQVFLDLLLLHHHHHVPPIRIGKL